MVSLQIHGRISTRALLRTVERLKPIHFDVSVEPLLPAGKHIEFYKHRLGRTNRMILGDSLLVRNSPLVKEDVAGKVHMVYVDPTYGIKYLSNFYLLIDRRDVIHIRSGPNHTSVAWFFFIILLRQEAQIKDAALSI